MDRRKQLKNEYKETPRPMGIYQIRNLHNNKVYLGSSLNLPGKLNSNRFQLEMGSHFNKDLQNDWNLHGPESFVLEILETLEPDKFLNEEWPEVVAEREEHWLNRLQPFGEKGYNKPKNNKYYK